MCEKKDEKDGITGELTGHKNFKGHDKEIRGAGDCWYWNK